MSFFHRLHYANTSKTGIFGQIGLCLGQGPKSLIHVVSSTVFNLIQGYLVPLDGCVYVQTCWVCYFFTLMRHKNLKQTHGQICSLSTLVKVFLPFSFSAFSPKKEMEKENGTWWWGREAFWWMLGEHVGENSRKRKWEDDRGEREGRLKLLELVHGTSTGVQLHTHSQEVYGKKRGPVEEG